MQTLTELFGVRKESFKDSVRKLSKTDIAGLENLSKQTVDDIFYGTGDYMKQLSVMEQDIVAPVVSIMNTAVPKGEEQDPDISVQEKARKRRMADPEDYASVGITSVASGILGIWAGLGFLPTILLSAVSGMAVHYAYSSIARQKRNTEESQSVCFSAQDAEAICAGFEDIFRKVDELVKIHNTQVEWFKAEKEKYIESSVLHNRYPAILECLQDLLSESWSNPDNDFARFSAKKINRALRASGYEPVVFDGDNYEDFEVLYSPDVEQDRMETPSIRYISTGGIVCKGKVYGNSED